MTVLRGALAGALLAVVALGSGCGLLDFIDRGEGYERSEPAPPLNVPPDLSRPPEDHSMDVPETGGTVPGPVGEAPLPPDLDGLDLPQAPEIELPRKASGAPYLSLRDTVDSAWRRTGLALERIGFDIENRDDLRMVYVVRYTPPAEREEEGGFFSWLFGSDREERRSQQPHYQVSVVGAGEERTEVMVLDKTGDPDRSDSAERILALIAERLGYEG